MMNENLNQDTQNIDNYEPITLTMDPPSNYKKLRRLTKPVLGSLALIFLLFLSFMYMFNYIHNRSNKSDAVLGESSQNVGTALPGTVSTVVRVNGESWKEVEGEISILNPGDPIEQGSRIITANSEVDVQLNDGSTLRLDQNTELHAKQLEPYVTNLEVIAGHAFVNVLENDLREFYLGANDVVAKAVGTQYSVSKDAQVVVYVYDGEVELTDRAENKHTILAGMEWQERHKVPTQMSASTVVNDSFVMQSMIADKNLGKQSATLNAIEAMQAQQNSQNSQNQQNTQNQQVPQNQQIPQGQESTPNQQAPIQQLQEDSVDNISN